MRRLTVLLLALTAAVTLITASAPSATASPKITLCTKGAPCAFPQNQIPIPDQLGAPVGEALFDLADTARVSCQDLGLARLPDSVVDCREFDGSRWIYVVIGDYASVSCFWDRRGARSCDAGGPSPRWYPILVVDDGNNWPR